MFAKPISHPGLEELVGQAIVDRELREGLLNGQRVRLLRRFDLSPDETQVLMNIRADSFGSLAQQLHTWIQAQRSCEAWRQPQHA